MILWDHPTTCPDVKVYLKMRDREIKYFSLSAGGAEFTSHHRSKFLKTFHHFVWLITQCKYKQITYCQSSPWPLTTKIKSVCEARLISVPILKKSPQRYGLQKSGTFMVGPGIEPWGTPYGWEVMSPLDVLGFSGLHYINKIRIITKTLAQEQV